MKICHVLDFHLLMHHAMKQHCWKNTTSHEGVKYVKAPPLTGTLWEVTSDGSRWVHTDAAITTPPNSYPLHFRTTIQIAKLDVLITICPLGWSV